MYIPGAGTVNGYFQETETIKTITKLSHNLHNDNNCKRILHNIPAYNPSAKQFMQ